MNLLEKYQSMINNHIEHIFLPSIPNGDLKEMTEYSLKGGKRLRSSIVLDITSNLLGTPLLDVALAVELLHNSSLIIDDLPTMDNDNFRRGLYTLHRLYGQEKAKMLAFFFVTEANRILLLRDDCKKDLVLHNLEFLKRACLGQYYDMEWAKTSKSEFKENYGDELSPIVNLKTAPFFSVAFVSGYIFSNTDKIKDTELNDIVKKLNSVSEEFSLAFQILDDFDDVEKDKKKGSLNHVLIYGADKSKELFFKLIDGFENGLKDFKILTPFFYELISYMKNRLK